MANARGCEGCEMKSMESDNTERFLDITAADLPLYCPTKSMRLWNTHPRVYLPIEDTGEALCPYCGTLYKLKGGAPTSHH